MKKSKKKRLWPTPGSLLFAIWAWPFICSAGFASSQLNANSADQRLPPPLLDERSGFELDLSIREQHRLEALGRRTVLEIAPVIQAPLDDPDTHLGWPVATMLPNGRIVMTFRQTDGHNGSHPGWRFVIHTDDLVNWHPKDILTRKEKAVGDRYGMHAIGWTPRMEEGEPRVLMVVGNTPHPGFTKAAYFSDDAGETWSDARSLNPDIPVGNQTGPNLIQHPVFGLTASWGQPGMQPFDPAGPRGNYLTRTLDAGLTWETREWINTEPSLPIEPAIATWGPGHMVILARDYSDFGYGDDPERKYFYLTQHVYTYEEGHTFQDVNFTTAASNISGNGAATNEILTGRPSQDTADVFFNPVSGRIEMLQSHRWGGGGEKTGTTLAENTFQESSSLNLWSIDPDALLAGSTTWRFDGTLIERIGYSRPGNKDGLHPGGSVLDLERGVQHIFVYAGWRRGPASIYRITRVLDTELWLTALAEVEEELKDIEIPDPSFPALHWTGLDGRWGGGTNAWSQVPFDDPAYPLFLSGISGGENGHQFVFDAFQMEGTIRTARMNRNDLTIRGFTFNAAPGDGLVVTNTDNNGGPLTLSGPLRVLGGAHRFDSPRAGRTIDLAGETTWTIAAGASLDFAHVLSGEAGLTKTGPGILRMGGTQLFTGELTHAEGILEARMEGLHLRGNLALSGGRLRFHPNLTMGTDGGISFEDPFGVSHLDGLDASVPPGSYRLISGPVNAANLENRGLTRAALIGPGKWAYFETEDGLTVTVVDAIPEPPTLSLQWIGFDANRPVLDLDGPAGATFIIETSTDLIDWTGLDTLAPTETPTQWTAPEALTEDRRFYRMKQNTAR